MRTLKRSLCRHAAILLCSGIVVCAWQTGVLGKTGSKPPKDEDGKSGDQTDVASKGGRHLGETRQLEVEITFWGEYGHTVTDETGTYYHRYSGRVSHEDKVYPPEYWGTFPLYYFGTLHGVTVTVRNNGPRRKAKLVIRTETYVLKTDGSSGASLMAPREIEIEVARGETEVIDASFISQPTPHSESGLDRFLVKVLHANQGDAAAPREPALIAVKEGVYCPPEEDGEDAADAEVF